MQSTTSQAKYSNYHHFVLEDRSNFIFVGSVDTCLNSKPSLLLNHNKFVFPLFIDLFLSQAFKAYNYWALLLEWHWRTTQHARGCPMNHQICTCGPPFHPFFIFYFLFLLLIRLACSFAQFLTYQRIFFFFLRLTGIMFHVIFRLVHQIIWGIYDEQSYFCRWKGGVID